MNGYKVIVQTNVHECRDIAQAAAVVLDARDAGIPTVRFRVRESLTSDRLPTAEEQQELVQACVTLLMEQVQVAGRPYWRVTG